MAQTIDMKLVLAVVKAETDVIVCTLRDKGLKRFARVFALSGVCMP